MNRETGPVPERLYHPHEILLEGGSRDVAGLRERLASAFPPERRVASVLHGAEGTQADGHVARLELAGTTSRWELPTHPDPALLAQLLAGCDLALVQGAAGRGALRVVAVDAYTVLDAMAGAVALTGQERPSRVPSGGIPFFAPGEERDLALLLEERAAETVREKPLLGLVAGCREADRASELATRLQGLVDETFVVGEAVMTGRLPGWLRPVTRTLGGAGYLGDLLAATTALPGCALLTVSGRDGDDAARTAVEMLVEGRDPLSDATALRGSQDSLPRNGAVLWEAKGLGRLWGFLGAGWRCPQRILNQCRTRLLEP